MFSPAWENLPEVVLGKVFKDLDIVGKIAVRRTCLTWRRALNRPEIWHTFAYSEKKVWESLFPLGVPSSIEDFEWYRKFHDEVLLCVDLYGKYFNHIALELKGTQSFEVFKCLSKVCHQATSFALLKRVEGESFSAPLKSAMLEFCKRNVRFLNVRLDDVNFPGQKNDTIPLGRSHSLCLQRLCIVNSFRGCSLSNLMYLVNLKELAINPNHMNFSLLKHLAGCSLRKLYIVANYKTKEFYSEALSNFHWSEIRKAGPKLRVYCLLSVSHEWSVKEVLLKPNMPLESLVYRKNMWLRNWEEMSRILSRYGDTLKEFVDFSLHDGVYLHTGHTDFSERIDKQILQIVEYCPKITTFTVKEVLSSATLLLIAMQKRQFPNFFIREDMIEYINDIPDGVIQGNAAIDFVNKHWQKENFCQGMSSLLGQHWCPLEKDRYCDLVRVKYSEFF